MEQKERDAKVDSSYLMILNQAHELRGDKLVTTELASALKEYTSAIELYLTVASNSNVPFAQRTRCQTACRNLMTRAEKLKQQISAQSKTQHSAQKPRTVADSEERLSVKEETILLKSSKINNGKYPPLKPGTHPIVTDSAELFT